MKRFQLTFILFILCSKGLTDIAPNPIVLKSIMTNVPCEIQMVSERVEIDLYSDSSFVSCSFDLTNHGDYIELPIGFPVMNFFHWRIGEYSKGDMDMFQIFVDSKRLDKNDIQVPEEMKNVYDKYMEVIWADEEMDRKQDSVNIIYGIVEKKNYTRIMSGDFDGYQRANEEIFEWRETKPYFGSDLYNEFDSLMKEGNYPWYIWNVKFEKSQSRTIRVDYRVPAGIGYGGEYRYLKYLLSTGNGWKDKIEKADITAKFHNIKVKTIEQISPDNYNLDRKSKTITWSFVSIEPTTENDIYVKYFNPMERRKYKRYMDKKIRNLNK